MFRTTDLRLRILAFSERHWVIFTRRHLWMPTLNFYMLALHIGALLSYFMRHFFSISNYNHIYILNNMSLSTCASCICSVDDVILLVWPPLITDLIYPSCFSVSLTYFALCTSSYTQVEGRPSIKLVYERDTLNDHVSTVWSLNFENRGCVNRHSYLHTEI